MVNSSIEHSGLLITRTLHRHMPILKEAKAEYAKLQ
jgi:hypothetical protein